MNTSQKFTIWNQYHNPYYYWWRVRAYFKRPRVHLAHAGKTTWFYGLPIMNEYYKKILDIRLLGLGWKTKYDEVRHEWDPYLAITILRRYQIIWVWNWIDVKDEHSHVRSIATWEAILDVLYSHVPAQEVESHHQWFASVDSSKIISIKNNMKI